MRTDVASKLIRAPAPAVYRAFTTAIAMETWLPPADMTGRMLAFDFRAGGSYRMQLAYATPRHKPGKTSADSDEVEVRFIRLVPDERIEQAVRFDSGDPAFRGEMRMTWRLEPVPGGTRVTVRCENVPAGIRREDHDAGLQATLANLARFVEAAGA